MEGVEGVEGVAVGVEGVGEGRVLEEGSMRWEVEKRALLVGVERERRERERGWGRERAGEGG